MLPPAVRDHVSLPRVKRFFVGCLAAAMLLSFAAPSSAVSISVVPGSSSIFLGDTLTVDFFVEDVADLSSFQFGVRFDSEMFQVIPLVPPDPTLPYYEGRIFEGDFLSTAGTTAFFPGLVDPALEMVLFNAGALFGFDEVTGEPIPGASGSGKLLTVEFLAVGTGTSAISAVFDDAQFADGLFNSLNEPIRFDEPPFEPGVPAPTYVADASVTVSQRPTQVPEPGTLSLLAAGIAASAVSARRRRRAAGRLRH